MKTNKIFLIILSIFFILTLTSCTIKKLNKDEYINLVYKYHTLMEKDNVCIDLRDLNTSYAKGHIKGFINYNYRNGSDEEFIVFMNTMYNKNIYVFLIDEDGSDVFHVAKLLKDNGYRHIIIYDGGYQKLEQYAKKYMQIVSGIDDCGC